MWRFPNKRRNSLLYLREKVLNQIILSQFRKMTAFVRQSTEEFYETATA